MKEIPRDIERDVYGEGGVVGELEGEVAKMLGKPAAVFLPMGQQIALRVHADRRDSRTVLWHPFCHLADNEADGYRRLHGLHGKAVGEPSRLLTINDLEKVAERPAALLLELPQRDLGGQLPAWHDLVAQVEGPEQGRGVHMDGARLVGVRAVLRAFTAGDLRALRHRLRVVLQATRRAPRGPP